jgi:hypothetical protein
MTLPPTPKLQGDNTISTNLWQHLSIAVFNVTKDGTTYTNVRMPTRQSNSRLERSIKQKLEDYDFNK